jgi:hypothetical protein
MALLSTAALALFLAGATAEVASKPKTNFVIFFGDVRHVLPCRHRSANLSLTDPRRRPLPSTGLGLGRPR